MLRPIMSVSNKVNQIPKALSIYINQLVYDLKRRNHDVIALSLGESFFNIPYFEFDQLDFNTGYHYSDSQGLPQLREKIARYYQNLYGSSITAQDILISAGSKALIFMCMQAVLNPGDEVVIHEPAWLSYQEQAHLVDAKVCFIPFTYPSHKFCDFFNEHTRMFILNNPNNPSGNIYTRNELLALYQECRSRGIYLLIDEAYSDFVLDSTFYSMATLVPDLDGVIIINSLSKNMGMSGWRIGYAIAETKILNALLKLNQHLITCAPTILQQYLAKYFDEILLYTLPQVQDVVAKRGRIAKRMDQLGLTYLSGSSTFYFFIGTENYSGNIHDLALYLLLEHGVAVVPGAAYGITTNHFLRVSIGTESEERIDYALRIIKNTLIGQPIDSSYVHSELVRLNLPVFSNATLDHDKVVLELVNN